ncbi:uncharacterized protein LOC144443597 [Glandiceps talaboti]
MADLADLKAVLAQRYVKFLELFAAGDVKGASEFYTEDCKFMAPGEVTKTGRQSVEEAFAGMRSSGITAMTLTIDELGGVDGGDTLFERGHYELLKEDGSAADVGKYVVIWKKVNGVYELAVDCFNSNN